VSHNIGVCSWSLQPTDAGNLITSLAPTGAKCLQLHLDPLRSGEWDEAASLDALRDAGIRILSGMVATKDEDYSTLASISETGGLRPDSTWDENRAAAIENAALAQRMGLSLISLHAGFLPEEAGVPERTKLVKRLREYIDIFAERDIICALETGQESATTLAEFLEELDRPRSGVNFDPANMLLYDKGDPVQALDLLAPWVRQIHIKDAICTKIPGTWGEEVPAGTGEVDWTAFFDVIAARKLDVDLIIEREAGDDRVGDIATAQTLVSTQLARIAGH
jgi:L-ribulose-5-phosphate 3-epimerase